MMNKPPVNDLERIAGCRYMLVTAVARRARQIMADPMSKKADKPVSAAVEELAEGQLEIRPIDESSIQ